MPTYSLIYFVLCAQMQQEPVSGRSEHLIEKATEESRPPNSEYKGSQESGNIDGSAEQAFIHELALFGVALSTGCISAATANAAMVTFMVASAGCLIGLGIGSSAPSWYIPVLISLIAGVPLSHCCVILFPSLAVNLLLLKNDVVISVVASIAAGVLTTVIDIGAVISTFVFLTYLSRQLSQAPMTPPGLAPFFGIPAIAILFASTGVFAAIPFITKYVTQTEDAT